MSLLSPPYSATLTLERDSGISFKSSFSLQDTGGRGMMEWGAAAFPEPTLVLLITFLLFLFLQSPHHTLVPSQLVLNFKLH